MKRILSISFILFPLFLLAQKFEVNPPSSWVKEIHPEIVSTFSKYDINSGVYSSLVDYQVNFELDEEFSHYSLKIVSESGVSPASDIKISYDSSYTKVKFHYLYIWRNGKKIDRTNDLKFEMMNNEQDLQFSIYSGKITSYTLVDDVRKNDIVEYAYTLIGDNPIFNNYRYKYTPLIDGNPIDYLSIRVLYPSSSNYYYKCINCKDQTINLNNEGNNIEVSLIKENIDAAEVEETMPSWYTPYPMFVITNYKNWKEVNEWALPLFKLENLNSIDFKSTHAEIFKPDYNIEQKINAIINYVQNDIRYLGIENGIGSFKPFPPKKVIEQRFGDCKDKALLMVALMRSIGINSCYPAMVNATIQEGIDILLPGGHSFNHCINYLEYKGKEFWIDPTLPHQGGTFMTKVIPDYGKALIIKKGNNSLTKMNIVDTVSRTEMNELFSISSFEGPTTLKVTTKLYGSNADFLRNVLEFYSLKDITKEFIKPYGALYPNIEELSRLEIVDDNENNIITTVESYQITDLWISEEKFGAQKLSFKYEPVALYNYISAQQCLTKKHPVQVPYPSHIKQRTTIMLPKNISIINEDKLYENDAFNFKKTKNMIGSLSLSLSYEYKNKTKVITKEGFKKACNDMNTLANDLPIEIFYYDY